MLTGLKNILELIFNNNLPFISSFSALTMVKYYLIWGSCDNWGEYMGDEIILENVVKDVVETFEIQTSDGYCVQVAKRHICDFKLDQIEQIKIEARKDCH